MLRLYARPRCADCTTLRLALGALGVPHELLAYNDPAHDRAWRALVPAGTSVPVLVDGPVVLSNVAVALEYLHDRFGGLLPDSPAERAAARRWVRWAEVRLGQNLREFLYERSRDSTKYLDEDALELGTLGVTSALPRLDRWLADGRAHLVGGRFSMADAAVLARLLLAEQHGLVVPPTEAHVRRWLAERREDLFVAAALAEP